MKYSRLVLLFLILLPLSKSYGQNCKFEKNENDPFTGKKIMITRADDGVFFSGGLLSSGTNGYVQIKKEGDQYSFYFVIHFLTDTKDYFRIDKGQEVIILLDNKDTIILKAKETKIGSSTFGQNNIANGSPQFLADVSNTYQISPSQINRILASTLSAVRLYMTTPQNSEYTYDMVVKKKKNAILINLLNCIKNPTPNVNSPAKKPAQQDDGSDN